MAANDLFLCPEGQSIFFCHLISTRHCFNVPGECISQGFFLSFCRKNTWERLTFAQFPKGYGDARKAFCREKLGRVTLAPVRRDHPKKRPKVHGEPRPGKPSLDVREQQEGSSVNHGDNGGNGTNRDRGIRAEQKKIDLPAMCTEYDFTEDSPSQVGSFCCMVASVFR